MLADNTASRFDSRQIGHVIFRNRRRYGDNDKGRLFQGCRVRGKFQRRLLHGFITRFARRIYAFFISFQFFLINIESQSSDFFSKS